MVGVVFHDVLVVTTGTEEVVRDAPRVQVDGVGTSLIVAIVIITRAVDGLGGVIGTLGGKVGVEDIGGGGVTSV